MERTAKPKHPPNKKKGVIYILLSWLFYTGVVALSRVVSEESSVPIILLFQNLIGLILVLPWMIKKGGKSLYLSKIGVIVIRSLAGYLSFAFIFLAVQRISLVNTVLLSNTAPLFIPIIVWLWKGVRIGKRLWMGVLIGFIGIAIILRPNHQIINVGALFALGAAICLSISAIAKRRLVKTEPIHTILFYYFLICTFLSIPFSFENWKPLSAETLLLLCLLGVFFSCAQLLFLHALRYAKPSFLGPFNYSAIVYGVIIQWLVWGNLPTLWTVVGIIVVCTGGIITITRGKEISSAKKDRSQNK